MKKFIADNRTLILFRKKEDVKINSEDFSLLSYDTLAEFERIFQMDDAIEIWRLGSIRNLKVGLYPALMFIGKMTDLSYNSAEVSIEFTIDLETQYPSGMYVNNTMLKKIRNGFNRKTKGDSIVNKIEVLEKIQDKIDAFTKDYKAKPEGSTVRMQSFAVVHGLEVAQGIVELLDETVKSTKPAIPKFIADWIVENRGNYNLRTALGNIDAQDYDVYNWVINNIDNFSRAWLDGYTLEKEQLYYLKLPNSGYFGELGNANYFERTLRKDMAKKFTEKEIKAIDERYWVFRMKVGE